MRIGVAQLNSTVGDFQGNLDLALDAYEQLVGRGAELVVYPELFLSGYPPRDLLLKDSFIEGSRTSLREFSEKTGPTPALIGFPEEIRDSVKVYNSAAWCQNSEIHQVFRKKLLPTYDVFDESRYFETGNSSMIREYKGMRFGVTICEDIWNLTDQRYSIEPLDELETEALDHMINLSASPWFAGKEKKRFQLLKEVVRKVNCSVTYVNAVGANDELLFDGSSSSLDRNGSLQAQSKDFEEHIDIHDLSDQPTSQTTDFLEMERLRKALAMGVRDYVLKSGFSKVVIGLSGGIDSAVTAAIAVDALGAQNVLGISLPSSISSEHSKQDAKELAENLGIEFHTISIQSLVSAASSELDFLFRDLPEDVTEENLQARSRGLLLMALSNKFNALLLTTGNKSELAVGYCTLYGDMCGGLAVISDVPKMKVFELAKYFNRQKILIPTNTIEKPPSAELRPDQKDSDSLPDYETLDAILHAYVEQGNSLQTIIENGYDPDVVRRIIRLVDLNEYKRKQAAPGLKTSPLAFGVGRRIPIVQKFHN
ncbi:MAG: NAD+ synthase [Verrucomicrobiota bacterium]|nr:NAD+ synthase [Verrucomicrobiota bacterium]